MTRHFGLTYDYRCPYARIAHEHVLVGLQAGADWEVTYLPFSLGQAHVAEGEPPVWERPEVDTGLLALQASIAVRDSHRRAVRGRPPRPLRAPPRRRRTAEGVGRAGPRAHCRRCRRRRRARRDRLRSTAGDRREGAHRLRRLAQRLGGADVHRRRPGRVRPPADDARRRPAGVDRRHRARAARRSTGPSSTSSSTRRSRADTGPSGTPVRGSGGDRRAQDDGCRGVDVAPGEGSLPLLDVRDGLGGRPPAGLRPPAGAHGAGDLERPPPALAGPAGAGQPVGADVGRRPRVRHRRPRPAHRPAQARARCASCSTWGR